MAALEWGAKLQMISLEAGIRPYTLDQAGRYLEHVGEWDLGQKGQMNQFWCGAYGFSNPYSANMFGYLFRRYDGAVAKSTVELFEKELKKSSAKKFWDLVTVNWGEVVARNFGKAINWENTVADMAIAAGGFAVTQLRLTQALPDQNPNSRKSDQPQYVWYAMAYWSKNPQRGPAYHVLTY